MSYTPINKGQAILEPAARKAEFERRRGFGVTEEYKENRHQWATFPKDQFVANYPLHVDIELASVCNLKCPMCYTITDHFKKQVNAKLMDYNLFTKIVDECAAGGFIPFALACAANLFYTNAFLTVLPMLKRGVSRRFPH